MPTMQAWCNCKKTGVVVLDLQDWLWLRTHPGWTPSYPGDVATKKVVKIGGRSLASWIWERMGREKPPKNYVIDHADRNPLNNRRSNLRMITTAQNCMNRDADPSSTTGVKGVYPAENGRYKSTIQVDGKLKYLGRRDTVEEAEELYLEAVKKYRAWM